MADPMDFAGWINVIITVIGVSLAGYGVWVLIAGRAVRWMSGPYSRPADAGKFALGFGLFFLLHAAGYFGVAAGLFGQLVRLALVVLAFAVGVFTFVRYRPDRLRTSRRP
jgi:hypothetical protein